MKYFAYLWVIIFWNFSFGQLQGVVLDSETSKPIPFATIHLVDVGTGVVGNEQGVFEILTQLPNHNKIKIVALGYADTIFEIEDSTQRVDLEIKLSPQHFHLHEAVVSTSTGIIQDYLITGVISKHLDELTTIKKTNLGEALASMEGVYNASTGNGVYKPVIRGLSGIRVISFLNGVKLENQQWGGDHGLGVSSVGIEGIEVIKGPSSLLYGADALGGVLYLTEEAFADQNSWSGSVFSQIESNTRGINNGIIFKWSKNNIRFNVFVNQQNHADYQIPNRKFVKQSRYNGEALKVMFGYNKGKWVTKIGYNYSTNTIGIPGHTHDSIFTVATFLTSKQEREEARPSQKIGNHLVSFDNQFFFHNSDIKITLGQNINRLEEYEKFTIPEIGMDLYTTSYYGRYRYKFSKNLNLITGIQGMYQTNSNLAKAEDQLIPNFSQFDKGLFAILSGRINKLNYQLGGRVDNREIKTENSLNDLFQFNSVNYSAGVSYKLKSISVRLNLSSGFRTPHISELLSDGIHHATQRYEIGDKSLTAETGHQLDFAIEYNNEHLSFTINPFVNNIKDYIYLQPIDSLIDDAYVYVYKQAKNTVLTGGEISLHYHPHFLHHFHLESNYSLVYGEDDNRNAISFVPQPRISTQLVYDFDETEKLFYLENVSLQHQYFFEQNRVVSFEIPSGSYPVFHLGVNGKFNLNKTHFDIGVGIKNIFNQTYIDHLSALKTYNIPNPGRNIYLSLKYNIKNNIK